jgi:hypothetical protein
VACTAAKRPAPAPAAELYDPSPLFRESYRQALSDGFPVAILSTKHGLVQPDDLLEPYERTLVDLSAEQRQTWQELVTDQLRTLVAELSVMEVVCLMSAEYRQAFGRSLSRVGVTGRPHPEWNSICARVFGRNPEKARSATVYRSAQELVERAVVTGRQAMDIGPLMDNQVGALWIAKGHSDGPEVFVGQVECPNCSRRVAVSVCRNSKAITDKPPAFLMFQPPALAEQDKIGHLFVGKYKTSPVLYFGQVYHCSEKQNVVAFFNRALNTSEQPVLVIMKSKTPQASSAAEVSESDVPF